MIVMMLEERLGMIPWERPSALETFVVKWPQQESLLELEQGLVDTLVGHLRRDLRHLVRQ